MEPDEVRDYKEAGRIARLAREKAVEKAKEGVSLLKLAEEIESKIIEEGAQMGFPVNLCLNEIAAHSTPTPRDETMARGILKIDIGTCVNGFIGDTAITIDLSEDGRFKEMIELNKKLLESAKKTVKDNMRIYEVGEAVTNTLSRYNVENETDYTIISGLTGHGLDKDQIHTSPSIPNYSNSNENILTEKAFAIEPFVTTGSGEIYEGSPGGIYSLKDSTKKMRDRDAREILGFIRENYKTRPFCERWLEKEGFKKIRFSLRELEKQGIIYQYPLLIEKTKNPVSQMEHTFLISDGNSACTTK